MMYIATSEQLHVSFLEVYFVSLSAENYYSSAATGT